MPEDGSVTNAQVAGTDRVTTTGRPKRRWPRLALMLSLPLLLALGGGFVWLTGGRYVSTENAYVQQDMVTVAPDVAGRISAVDAHENEAVEAGQVLFRIDPDPYRLALRQAEAAIASARLRVDQLRADYHEAIADRDAAEENVAYQRRNFERQSTLAKGGYAAQARFDEARHELQAAEQRLAGSIQAVASALAALGGDPDIGTDDHPQVLEAVAHRDKAALDLDHTVVHAPAAGVVSQTDRLQAGQFLPVGTPVLSLVKTGESWVEANFKETDLTYMQVGQKAEIELDAYPGRKIEATVASIGAGTGSEFSLLPAQNATGNWVKVVQRVPVRLRLPAPDGVPLRAGLSASVEVDTGHTRTLPGPIRSAVAAIHGTGNHD